MSKILILGDLHQNFHILMNIFNQIKAKLPQLDAVIQVGDFGFNENFYEKIKLYLHERGFKDGLHIPLYVVDGNHEAHEWLYQQPKQNWKDKYNIIYQPRGSVIEIDGSIIGFIGGALNVDSDQSYHGDNLTNYIKPEEIQLALDNFSKYEQIDLLVTHTCGHSLGIGMRGALQFEESIEKFCTRRGFTTGLINDCGDEALSHFYRRKEFKVLNNVFGHFHYTYNKKVKETNFYCVGCADLHDRNSNINVLIYDTIKKEVEFFPEIKIQKNSI